MIFQCQLHIKFDLQTHFTIRL